MSKYSGVACVRVPVCVICSLRRSRNQPILDFLVGLFGEISRGQRIGGRGRAAVVVSGGRWGRRDGLASTAFVVVVVAFVVVFVVVVNL